MLSNNTYLFLLLIRLEFFKLQRTDTRINAMFDRYCKYMSVSCRDSTGGGGGGFSLFSEKSTSNEIIANGCTH